MEITKKKIKQIEELTNLKFNNEVYEFSGWYIFENGEEDFIKHRSLLIHKYKGRLFLSYGDMYSNKHEMPAEWPKRIMGILELPMHLMEIVKGEQNE